MSHKQISIEEVAIELVHSDALAFSHSTTPTYSQSEPFGALERYRETLIGLRLDAELKAEKDSDEKISIKEIATRLTHAEALAFASDKSFDSLERYRDILSGLTLDVKRIRSQEREVRKLKLASRERNWARSVIRRASEDVKSDTDNTASLEERDRRLCLAKAILKRPHGANTHVATWTEERNKWQSAKVIRAEEVHRTDGGR